MFAVAACVTFSSFTLLAISERLIRTVSLPLLLALGGGCKDAIFICNRYCVNMVGLNIPVYKVSFFCDFNWNFIWGKNSITLAKVLQTLG